MESFKAIPYPVGKNCYANLIGSCTIVFIVMRSVDSQRWMSGCTALCLADLCSNLYSTGHHKISSLCPGFVPGTNSGTAIRHRSLRMLNFARD